MPNRMIEWNPVGFVEDDTNRIEYSSEDDEPHSFPAECIEERFDGKDRQPSHDHVRCG